MGAPVMVDDPLGVARSTRCIVQADRVPFIDRRLPRVVGVALRKQRFVVERAQPLSAVEVWIVDVDDQELTRALCQRVLDHA